MGGLQKALPKQMHRLPPSRAVVHNQDRGKERKSYPLLQPQLEKHLRDGGGASTPTPRTNPGQQWLRLPGRLLGQEGLGAELDTALRRESRRHKSTGAGLTMLLVEPGTEDQAPYT